MSESLKSNGKPYSNKKWAIYQRNHRDKKKRIKRAKEGYKETGDFQTDMEALAKNDVFAAMDFVKNLIETSWTIIDAKVVSGGVKDPEKGFLLQRNKEGDMFSIGINTQSKGTNPLFLVKKGNLKVIIRVKKKFIKSDEYEDWLEIKESKIRRGGLGLFALRPFQKDEYIGLYCGGLGKKETIHSLDDSNGTRMVPKSNHIYMGMQYLNSATKKKNNNVEVYDEFLVQAVKDIKVGEELLWHYNYKY